MKALRTFKRKGLVFRQGTEVPKEAIEPSAIKELVAEGFIEAPESTADHAPEPMPVVQAPKPSTRRRAKEE